jgi:hypothetical protein
MGEAGQQALLIGEVSWRDALEELLAGGGERDEGVALGYRIDLVDEHLALDEHGTGRGFITFCLHWKHAADFGGLAPTGREGTSVETLLFTITGNQIVRIDVADNTLDLGIYEWERGWPIPHNIRPQPIVTGVDRRQDAAAPQPAP